MIDIVAECESAKVIGIGGHIKPDGDCIGSTLALSLYLKKRFPYKEITVYLEQPSECFAYVEETRLIQSTFETKHKPDLFIVVDTVSDRLGDTYKMFEGAAKTINIDHHISNEAGCADVNFIVPTASSASELVYLLMDKEYIDESIAKLIYLGITHDTGVFKYSNTSPQTLQIAAELIAYGFDFSELLDKTFYEKTYAQNLAMGRVLLESQRFLDGKVIFGYMDLKTMNSMHVTGKDFDGVINQLRITQGVECAIFMHQMNACTYKVSMRSNGIADVSKVAVAFGGGGHVRASGFYSKGEPRQILDKILALVSEYYQ